MSPGPLHLADDIISTYYYIVVLIILPGNSLPAEPPLPMLASLASVHTLRLELAESARLVAQELLERPEARRLREPARGPLVEPRPLLRAVARR